MASKRMAVVTFGGNAPTIRTAVWEKIQGFDNAARPIMTPSQPVCSSVARASATVEF